MTTPTSTKPDLGGPLTSLLFQSSLKCTQTDDTGDRDTMETLSGFLWAPLSSSFRILTSSDFL